MILRGPLRLMNILVISASWLLSGAALASELDAHPGYLASVQGERDQKTTDFVLVPKPDEVPRSWYARSWVDEKLKVEFKSRYEVIFGFSEAQRDYYSLNRYTFYQFPSGQVESIEQYRVRQQQFGEYMVRRLVEYHVDNYARSNAETRPLYELKDRIGNFDLSVRKGYDLKVNYSYSGQFLELRLENPYDIRLKSTVQIRGSRALTDPDDTLQVGHSISKNLELDAYQEMQSQATTVIGRQRLTRAVTASVTASYNARVDRNSTTFGDRRHNLLLIGLVWTQ